MNAEKPQEDSESRPISPEAEFLRRLRSGLLIGLLRVLILILVLLVLSVLFVPNFLEVSIRSYTSRAKTDLRTLHTAFESYKVEHETYPPGSAYFGPPLGLTTPIAYLTAYPQNLYSKRYATYVAKVPEAVLLYVLAPMTAIGVAMVLAAAAVFLLGRQPKRFANVLRLGIAGTYWATLSILAIHAIKTEWALWGLVWRPLVDGFQFYPLVILSAVYLLVFLSGVHKAMEDSPWRAGGHGIDVAAVFLWLAIAFVSTQIVSDHVKDHMVAMDFREPSDESYLYATDGGNRFIVWSAGPDLERDLPEREMPEILARETTQSLETRLSLFAYDPTNGSLSPGDIWRSSR